MPFARVPLQSLAAVGFILAGVPFWYIRVKYKETFSTQGNHQYIFFFIATLNNFFSNIF